MVQKNKFHRIEDAPTPEGKITVLVHPSLDWNAQLLEVDVTAVRGAEKMHYILMQGEGYVKYLDTYDYTISHWKKNETI